MTMLMQHYTPSEKKQQICFTSTHAAQQHGPRKQQLSPYLQSFHTLKPVIHKIIISSTIKLDANQENSVEHKRILISALGVLKEKI